MQYQTMYRAVSLIFTDIFSSVTGSRKAPDPVAEAFF
jgi:hypothetical protein